jgi:hypothetical protein
MNYKEVSDLLVKIGDEAGLKVFQTDASSGLTVTALYVILQWFVAVELNHRLNFGVYHGPDLRLVGTKQIRFDQLTPRSPAVPGRKGNRHARAGPRSGRAVTAPFHGFRCENEQQIVSNHRAR